MVQRGLELLRAETEAREAEIAALRGLLAARVEEETVAPAEGRSATEAMMAAKRRAHGL